MAQLARQASVAWDLDGVMSDALVSMTAAKPGLRRVKTFTTVEAARSPERKAQEKATIKSPFSFSMLQLPTQYAKSSPTLLSEQLTPPPWSHDRPMPEPVISVPEEEPPTSGGSLANLRLLGISAVLVISGVLTNVAFELLSKRQPGCSSLLTMCQYVTALAGGGGGATLRYIRSPALPLRVHGTFCLLMFLTAFCGNLSVDFNLPFPLYLIIKSSNLVASMAVGAFFGKSYSRQQLGAVIMMTAGVVLATLVSSSNVAVSAKPSTGGSGDSTSVVAAQPLGSFGLLAGSLLCALSTFSMALLGVMQERAFATHGQHHGEAIFYIHMLGLVPLLLLQPVSPLARMRALQADEWMLVALNLIACTVCKRAFFATLGASSALSASLGILAYRFAGILLSALYFNSPPPPPASMFVAIALVVAGGTGYLASSSASPAASSESNQADRATKDKDA